MKEIKFRGKSKYVDEWAYGAVYVQDISGQVFIIARHALKSKKILNLSVMVTDFSIGNLIAVIPETVGQFTGHKDKHGKDIYDGDILNWDDECVIVIMLKDNELGIYYKILSQKDKTVGDFDVRFYRSDGSAEIIGNRFDNPKWLAGTAIGQ